MPNSDQIKYISRYAYPEQLEMPHYVESANIPINGAAYRAHPEGQMVIHSANTFEFAHNIPFDSKTLAFHINERFSPQLPKDLSYQYTMNINYRQDQTYPSFNEVQYTQHGDNSGTLDLINFQVNLFTNEDKSFTIEPRQFLHIPPTDLYYSLKCHYDHNKFKYLVTVYIYSFMAIKNLR